MQLDVLGGKACGVILGGHLSNFHTNVYDAEIYERSDHMRFSGGTTPKYFTRDSSGSDGASYAVIKSVDFEGCLNLVISRSPTLARKRYLTGNMLSDTLFLEAICAKSQETVSADVKPARADGILVKIYEAEDLGNHRLAARYFMHAAEATIANYDFAQLNSLIARADFGKLHSRAIVGLFRCTARVKENIPSWNSAYRKACKRLEELKKNPTSLFFGLPEVRY